MNKAQFIQLLPLDARRAAVEARYRPSKPGFDFLYPVDAGGCCALGIIFREMDIGMASKLPTGYRVARVLADRCFISEDDRKDVENLVEQFADGFDRGWMDRDKLATYFEVPQ